MMNCDLYWVKDKDETASDQIVCLEDYSRDSTMKTFLNIFNILTLPRNRENISDIEQF